MKCINKMIDNKINSPWVKCSIVFIKDFTVRYLLMTATLINRDCLQTCFRLLRDILVGGGN